MLVLGRIICNGVTIWSLYKKPIKYLQFFSPQTVLVDTNTFSISTSFKKTCKNLFFFSISVSLNVKISLPFLYMTIKIVFYNVPLLSIKLIFCISMHLRGIFRWYFTQAWLAFNLDVHCIFRVKLIYFHKTFHLNYDFE